MSRYRKSWTQVLGEVREGTEAKEAVVVEGDYKYDGKVVKISKKNFSKVHKDYKNSTKGKETMLINDPKTNGTISVPVQFEEVTLGDQLDQIVEDAEIDEWNIEESAGLQLKMAFDDAGIKVKGVKSSKLVISKKDKKEVEKIIAKQMKKPADAKRVLGSQIVFEDIELEEEFWAVIDKAKGGEVMAVTSDEKGAKSSVKMSNFSKHDYHFNKDPRTLKIVKVMGKHSQKKAEKMIGTKLSFKEEVAEAKGTAYPATIDTLKKIVKDKQNQIVMFKSGQARVDSFTASAMVAVYDAMKPATKKKFEEMIKDKGGFMKTQAFAMKMTEDAKWIDQIKEDPSMLELHYSLVQIDEAVHDKKSTFTMAPFEDLRSVADVALKIMQRQPQEVKEEEKEVTSEETPQKLTE